MLVGLNSKTFIENIERISILGPYVVWNFSSYYQGVQQLNVLPDIRYANIMDEREFDIQYFNFIMNNDGLFYEFFSKIVYPLYEGKNVYLLIDNKSELYNSILESLFKIMQDHYGYNCCYIINEIDDIDFLSDDSIFNAIGVYNLDNDKQRYSMMYGRSHLSEIQRENSKGGN